MSELAIRPYVSYEGEGAYPATNRLVVVYRVHREGGGASSAWLAHTGEDGALHPLFDDYDSPTCNRVSCYRHPTKGDLFSIDKFKRPHDVRQDVASLYKHPMTFKKGELVGLFLLAERGGHLGDVSLAKLRAEGLLRKRTIGEKPSSSNGKAGQEASSLRRAREDKQYWVALPCDYDSYLFRLRGIVQRLDALIKQSRDSLGRLLYCSALIDQLEQHLHAQRKARYQYWFLKLSDKPPAVRVARARKSGIETELLVAELVQPMREQVARDLSRVGPLYQRRLDECGSELARILFSKPHHDAFRRRFARELEGHQEIEGHVRRTYERAYVLASRTSSGGRLHQGHIRPLLDAVAKNKNKSRDEMGQALLKVAESVGWTKTLGDGVIEIVYAYAAHDRSAALTALRHDVTTAMYFLESKGLATDAKKLEKLLDDSMLHLKKVEAEEFVVKAKWAEASPKVLGAIVAALKVGSLIAKEKPTIREKVDAASEVAGSLADVSESKALAGLWPKSAGVAANKGLATVSSALSWGLAVHELYAKAGEGDGLDMAIAAVSYCGKTFTLGGQTALLMGNLPLAAALTAIGKACELAATVVGGVLCWIRDYKTEQLAAYDQVLTALKSADVRDSYHNGYRVASRERVDRTGYFKSKIAPDDCALAAAKKEWTRSLSSQYVTVQDLLTHHFSNKTWGLVERLP
jgi:hypothetical protein